MLSHLQSGLPGLGLQHVVAPLLTLLPERPAHQTFIVDDQDFLGGHPSIAYYGLTGCAVGQNLVLPSLTRSLARVEHKGRSPQLLLIPQDAVLTHNLCASYSTFMCFRIE